MLLIEVVAPHANAFSQPVLEAPRRVSYFSGHGTRS